MGAPLCADSLDLLPGLRGRRRSGGPALFPRWLPRESDSIFPEEERLDPFERRPLGKTGLELTPLGQGGGPLAAADVSDEQAVKTVRAGLAAGVRLFDTAPLYGAGVSERRYGLALAGVPRDSFALATKVGRALHCDFPPATPSESTAAWHFDFSYDATFRIVEASLRRLGLDSVDILHIHDPDNHEREALAGAHRALVKLKEQGVCRAIGSGMNQADMLARFAREAEFDCFLLAGRYTLLDQIGLVELLPRCVEKGIRIIVGGPYNSGILAVGAGPTATYNYQPAAVEIQEKARRIAAVCARYDVPLRAAAIQFPLAHPAVISVIPGARSVDEVADNASMLAWPIPGDLWRDLRRGRLIAPEAPVPDEPGVG